VLSGLAWETTLDDWIAGLPLSRAFKADVLAPWLTALIGCTRSAARGTSPRSILQSFALSFPADIVRGAALAPASRTLQALHARRAQAGRAGVSYAL
jgi:hypothetical protein